MTLDLPRVGHGVPHSFTDPQHTCMDRAGSAAVTMVSQAPNIPYLPPILLREGKLCHTMALGLKSAHSVTDQEPPWAGLERLSVNGPAEELGLFLLSLF